MCNTWLLVPGGIVSAPWVPVPILRFGVGVVIVRRAPRGAIACAILAIVISTLSFVCVIIEVDLTILRHFVLQKVWNGLFALDKYLY